MKALVYTGNQQMEYRDEPEPQRAEGESLIEISAVGICGSDMHAWMGHDERRVPPLILGHEAVGTVVEGRLQGKRVAINPLVTCGKCSDCLGGRSNICRHRDIIGMYKAGAFATHLAVSDHNLIEIPSDMQAAHAALTEPCGTALHAVVLANRVAYRPLSELNALVIGGGAVGLFAALVLRDQGVADIHLAETNELRRATARSAGIVNAFNPIDNAPEPAAFDVIIDAVGSGRTREFSTSMARPGGVIVHVGLQDNEAGLNTRYMTLQEVTLIGSYTYTMEDLKVSVHKLHSGAYGDLSWLEERSLADGGAAFNDLHAGRCAAPKIVLRP
ncbi:MAG: alcohol dehydrogenase catalytic domain-containing protein [Pseudomonadota bacterium]